MTNNEHIDQLFRDKLYHREFEFNPQHWENAQRMIEEQEKRGILGGKSSLMIISAMVIFTGIGAYFLLSSDDKNHKESEKILPKNEITNTPQLISNSEKEEIQSDENIKSDIAEGEGAYENSASVNKNKLRSKENKSAKNKTAVNNSKPENIVDSTQSDSVKPKNANQPETTGQETTDEYDGPEIFKLNKSVITINEENNKLEGKPLKSKKSKSKTEKSAPKQTIGGPNMENSDVNCEEYIENEKQEEKTMQAQLSHNQEIYSGDENSVIMPESDNQNLEINTAIPLKDRLNWLRHISIGIMAGENISSDFKNTSSSYGNISIRPIGGLRVAYQLNETTDVESGIFYNYRAGLNSQFTTLVSKDAGANINYYSTEKTLSLHYVDLPVYFTCKLDQHSFIAGMQYSHLINTYVQIENISEENGYSTVENSSKHWQKNDGRFSNCDVAAVVGYEYEISDRIKFCVRYNRGFFDATDNSFFGNSVRDINKQFRIMLDYRFVKY